MTTGELTRARLLIGDDWTDALSGRIYEQAFPYTGAAVGIAPAASRQDARAAVDAAERAFGDWSHSAPAVRRAILSKGADLLMERQQEIAGTVTEETGGVFCWGMFNVELAAGMLREAAAQAYGLVGEVIPSNVPGKLAMGVRAPAGVVVAIAPWNAPVILATRAVATPLAYANTVVLKASEICPLADVSQDMRLYAEESFGPLLAIVPVDGPDEAVRVANDTEYGLSAAVFSENVPAALELAQRIESGICHINDTTVHDEPQMPFGGVKASGFGRFGGRAALQEFTELRWITVQDPPRQYPI